MKSASPTYEPQPRPNVVQSEVISARASPGDVASAAVLASVDAFVPASTGETLGAAGHPLEFHVHVNSPASEHESGSGAHAPVAPLKHQPQPMTGVQEPQVVYALQTVAYGAPLA